MSFINEATVMGNLGGDPKLKTHANGLVSCAISIATHDANKKVTWHKVILWGKLAEVVHQYMEKGDKLWVRGAIVHRSFKDKESDVIKYIHEIQAQNIKIISTKKPYSDDSSETIQENSFEDEDCPL